MEITRIYHSGFLVETGRFYYIFDYEKGSLPELKPGKPVFVLCSHSHADHYNPEIFGLLAEMGMKRIRAVLSDDIEEMKMFLINSHNFTIVQKQDIITKDDKLGFNEFVNWTIDEDLLILVDEELLLCLPDIDTRKIIFNAA